MTMIRALPLFAMLLSGCAVLPDPLQPLPPPSADRYRALGTEPFWSVRLADGQMTYESAEGDRIAVATPEARPTFNGRRYETADLTLDITSRACSDGMSDRTYPDSVTVLLEDRTLNGCGGDPEDAAMTLDGTDWRIATVNGRAASRSTLGFAEGRISGRACNRYSGPYRIDGETLVTGPIAATRMACPGPLMDEEARLFAALRVPLVIRQRTDARMVLESTDGAHRIVLARA